MNHWEWGHAALGGLASVIFLFQTFSADDDDGGDGAHDAHLSDYLSLRNLVGFFIGYGWVTLASLLSGIAPAVSSLFGVGAGLVFVFTSLALIKTFLKFQEDGTLKLEKLVGSTASVYIAIEGSGGAPGKVMVDTDKGRMELPARTEKSEKLAPGTLVRIVGADDGVLWVDRRTASPPSA